MPRLCNVEPYPVNETTTKPDMPLRSEIAMSRFILICSFAATLAASATQSADAAVSGKKSAWEPDSLACADVGIDPGSPIFEQCVADLRNSLWAAKNQNLAN